MVSWRSASRLLAWPEEPSGISRPSSLMTLRVLGYCSLFTLFGTRSPSGCGSGLRLRTPHCDRDALQVLLQVVQAPDHVIRDSFCRATSLQGLASRSMSGRHSQHQPRSG